MRQGFRPAAHASNLESSINATACSRCVEEFLFKRLVAFANDDAIKLSTHQPSNDQTT
jgi:hypothetical protein